MKLYLTNSAKIIKVIILFIPNWWISSKNIDLSSHCDCESSLSRQIFSFLPFHIITWIATNVICPSLILRRKWIDQNRKTSKANFTVIQRRRKGIWRCNEIWQLNSNGNRTRQKENNNFQQRVQSDLYTVHWTPMDWGNEKPPRISYHTNSLNALCLLVQILSHISPSPPTSPFLSVSFDAFFSLVQLCRSSLLHQLELLKTEQATKKWVAEAHTRSIEVACNETRNPRTRGTKSYDERLNNCELTAML